MYGCSDVRFVLVYRLLWGQNHIFREVVKFSLSGLSCLYIIGSQPLSTERWKLFVLQPINAQCEIIR